MRPAAGEILWPVFGAFRECALMDKRFCYTENKISGSAGYVGVRLYAKEKQPFS